MARLKYDYIHCHDCNRLINRDIDQWYLDSGYTFCTDCYVLACRDKLEKVALETICACWYYDFADNIGMMTDKQLEDIIAYNGVECVNCG